jgi:hypothetical protein
MNEDDGYYDAETGIYYSNNFARKSRKLTIEDIPTDIIYKITEYLEDKDIFNFLSMNKYFSKLYIDENKDSLGDFVVELFELSKNRKRVCDIDNENSKTSEFFNDQNPIILNLFRDELYLVISPIKFFVKTCDLKNVLDFNYKSLIEDKIYIFEKVSVEIKLNQSILYIQINIDDDTIYTIKSKENIYKNFIFETTVNKSKNIVKLREIETNDKYSNLSIDFINHLNPVIIKSQMNYLFVEPNSIILTDLTYKIIKRYSEKIFETEDKLIIDVEKKMMMIMTITLSIEKFLYDKSDDKKIIIRISEYRNVFIDFEFKIIQNNVERNIIL